MTLIFFIATITNWSKTLPEFKKVPDQEKLQQFKLLLRAYQGEIDAITKREKATAQAFLTVYNALGQAPDPAKLLQVAAVSLCFLYPYAVKIILVRHIVLLAVLLWVCLMDHSIFIFVIRTKRQNWKKLARCKRRISASRKRTLVLTSRLPTCGPCPAILQSSSNV